MLTDKEALKTAKEELCRAIYLSECSRSAGIRAINKDKAEWLSVLIYNAEQNIQRNLDKEIQDLKLKSMELSVHQHYDKEFAKMIMRKEDEGK